MSDVLVLGGGIIGCAIARELTRRGLSVTLIDARGIGQGASQASAGMLVPFNEGRHDPVMQTLGARSLELYDEWIESLATEGAEVPYSRCGSLEVATEDQGAGVLADAARSLADEGIPHELIDAVGLRQAVPGLSPAARIGLRIQVHGCVGVPDLVNAFWESAAARGAQLLHAQVQRVIPGHGLVRVETDTRTLEAPHAVLAIGCWAGEVDLAGAPPLPIRPVRGQLLALRSHAIPPGQTVWGPRCYAVPWTGGSLLIGATVENVGFDERATAGGTRDLLEAAAELIPSVLDADFLGVRVGLRPGSPDDRPVVGASARIEGLVYATGHYRNGALLAPVTGAAIADLVQGHKLDAAWDPCSPARFGEY